MLVNNNNKVKEMKQINYTENLEGERKNFLYHTEM